MQGDEGLPGAARGERVGREETALEPPPQPDQEALHRVGRGVLEGVDVSEASQVVVHPLVGAAEGHQAPGALAQTRARRRPRLPPGGPGRGRTRQRDAVERARDPALVTQLDGQPARVPVGGGAVARGPPVRPSSVAAVGAEEERDGSLAVELRPEAQARRQGRGTALGHPLERPEEAVVLGEVDPVVLAARPTVEPEPPAAVALRDLALLVGDGPRPGEAAPARGASALEGLDRRDLPDAQPQQEGVPLHVSLPPVERVARHLVA